MTSISRVFHLKKVYVILGYESGPVRFRQLESKLQHVEIACDVRVLRENESFLQGIRIGKEKPDAGSVSGKAAKAADERPSACETLYITDDEVLLNDLLARDLPVAAYLHEGNVGQKFLAAKYAFEKPEELEPEYLERVYRRYFTIPWDILETDRCIVRESIPEDIDAFYEIYQVPEMTRYTDALYEHKSSEKAALKEYIEKVYHYYEFGIWTVLLKETGQVIGRAGLNIREGYDLPELGYMIGKPWQNKGLATEVCRAIIEYAREEFGLDRIQALIQEDNTASLRVAGKLGFRQAQKDSVKGKEYLLLVKEPKISQ